MRTNQIQGIIFTRNKELSFLLLKRNEKKGGFWQPITGGMEGDERPLETLVRELEEELSISSEYKVVDIDYKFQFTLENGNTLTEYVFGIEVPKEIEFTLSDEHVESRWVNRAEALEMLKWESNKEALVMLEKYLAEESHKNV